MLLYDVIEQFLLLCPDARGVLLSSDFYHQHMLEQADKLGKVGEASGLTFYVNGCRVIEDSDLPEESIEFVTWPDGIPDGWDPETDDRRSTQ